MSEEKQATEELEAAEALEEASQMPESGSDEIADVLDKLDQELVAVTQAAEAIEAIENPENGRELEVLAELEALADESEPEVGAEEEPVAEPDPEPEPEAGSESEVEIETEEEDIPNPEDEPWLGREDEDEADSESDLYREAETDAKNSIIPELSKGAWLALACAALLLGIILGRFVFGGASLSDGSLKGKMTVTESELNLPIATVSYAGKTETITVRDAILQNSSLEAATIADGEYSVPPAEAALTAARNLIIDIDAEKHGITVTDEEIAEYALEMLGTSDYEVIAGSYGMDEEGIVEMLRISLVMSKLRDEVIGVTDVAMPEPPEAPAAATTSDTTTESTSDGSTTDGAQAQEDAANVRTAEYSAYIIELVGDEWDAQKGTWASLDGTYASVLSSYDITADGATYEAAELAYYVAYQLYTQSLSDSTAAWSEYVNGLLANADITISTLVA